MQLGGKEVGSLTQPYSDLWKEEGIAQPSLERWGLAFCAKGSKAGRQAGSKTLEEQGPPSMQVKEGREQEPEPAMAHRKGRNL